MTCRSFLPLGLLLLALSTVFVFAGDRGHFYRPGHHDWVSSEHLAVAVNLGAVAALVGLSILTFNFTNEWLALNGSRALTDLPSFRSMLKRAGVDTAAYDVYLGLDWPSFLERQFSRIGGGISLPFSVASRVNDVVAHKPNNILGMGVADAIIGYVMSAACLLTLIGLTLVRRPRHWLPLATLPLSGFCWSLPMRYNVAFHDYEALFYLGIPLVLFSLVLLGVRRLAGGGTIISLAIAALLVFVLSSYEMGRIGHDGYTAVFQKAMVADFETIRELTAGRSVIAATQKDADAVTGFVGARHALHYYLAGSPVAYNRELNHGDFLVTRNRIAGVATLNPDNRGAMYLYDTASLIEAYQPAYRSIRSGEPLSRSHFDLYLHDPGGAGAGVLSYVKEPCNRRDRSAMFFLNVTPVDRRALAEDRTEHRFESRIFSFYEEAGLAFHGMCMVTVDLPDYEIASITTGQLTGKDRIWEVSFNPDKSL